MANQQRTYIMWFLKIKSIATGKYQTIEKNNDLTALLKEGDQLVSKGIKIKITAEKKEPNKHGSR